MLADDKVRMFLREALFIFASSPEHFDWVCGMFLSFFYFVYCIITHSTVPSMLSRMSLRGGSEKTELIFNNNKVFVLRWKFPVTTLRLVLGVVNAENELHGADPGVEARYGMKTFDEWMCCAIKFSSFSIEHGSGIFSWSSECEADWGLSPGAIGRRSSVA